MPIYEFQCLKCHEYFELLVIKQDEEVQLKCPECNSEEFERVLSKTGYCMGNSAGETGRLGMLPGLIQEGGEDHRLAHAHRPGERYQSHPLLHPVDQRGQSFPMALGEVEVPGVRGQVEGLFIQAKERFIHVCYSQAGLFGEDSAPVHLAQKFSNQI